MEKADQEAAFGWAFSQSHVIFRFHADIEMRYDQLTKDDVMRAGKSCEVLEDYPTRSEGRTKVLLGFIGPDEPVHIVANVRLFESDLSNRVEIVTVYRPEPPRWVDERTRGRK
ncbi:MAG: DUF4258 domain-containing protein [Actinobacteria bacterium]|nr:DUF4258 domain-containing protein [Actinomycetota bacterium]